MKSVEERIVSLSESEDLTELQEHLLTLDHQQLQSVVSSSAVKGRNVSALIKALFKGSPEASEEGSKRRLLLYQHCVSLCESGELHTETANQITALLMMETGSLSGSSLAQLASFFVDSVKGGKTTSGKSLELFPSVLSNLTAHHRLTYAQGELSGEQYKKQIINSLCSSRWDPQSVIHLTTMFREVRLSSEELQFVVDKVIRMFPKVDLQEIPPLIYQLLLLAAKGCQKQILEGIISYFREQDILQQEEQKQPHGLDLEVQSVPQDSLRHVEGTSILHIVFSIRLNHELARELLKAVKTSYSELCPFSVAVLLSVSRIPRYEEQVFEVLRSALVKSYRDQALLHNSRFLLDNSPPISSLQDITLTTVDNSVYGWDHVTQGVVQLGFFLMDSCKAAGGGGGGAGGGAGGGGRSLVPSSPSQLAARLGGKLLLQGFKIHEPIRAEILEQVLNRLVTKTASPVNHYLELFSDLVSSSPVLLLESSSKLTETFHHLSFLPLSTVQSLLTAVQPLLKVSVSLRDSLILVLKKAMFSSHLDGRKSAVSGFLLLLKNFKVLGSLTSWSQSSQSLSSSQVQVDVHARYNSAANEAFCLEILSSLRRCLSQQADVRMMLYQGFYDVLRRNSQLAGSIMRTLLAQLQSYYESDEELLPPVRLELCISAAGDTVYLLEPLAHLLSVCLHCLLWLQDARRSARRRDDGDDEEDDEEDEEEEDEGYQRELQNVLESISRRLAKSQLEDFELDKSSEFSVVSSVGLKNNIFSVLLLGVYEVLMEFRFHTAQYSQTGFQDLLQLFTGFHKLSEILKEKSGKGRVPANKTPRSFLSLRFVSTLLTALLRDNSQSREEALSVLRSSPEFLRYALSVAVQKIQHLEESGQTDGPDGQNPETAFRFLCDITKVLMWRYTNVPAAPEDRKERRCSVSLLCLEGLLRVFSAVEQRFPRRTETLLKAMDIEDDEGEESEKQDHDQLVYFYIRQFQRALVSQLSVSEEEFNGKEAQLIVNILTVLSRRLTPSSPQFVLMLDWTMKVCKETSFEDAGFCKVLLSLLFVLQSVHQSPVSLLLSVCQDVHSTLGDIDQDVEVESQSHFAIINTKTAPTAALLVLVQIERVIDEADWLIGRMKTMTSSSDQSDAVEPVLPVEPVEKAVLLQLGSLLSSLNELLQSLLAGICSVNLLKTAGRCYAVLTAIVRYFIQVSSSRAPPTRMEKLVKLSGSHLTPQCYAFITFVQGGEVGGDDKKRKRSDANSSASAKLLRDTKAIPSLIFSIEQYEKFLITLSKKTKVNLMQFMKLSTSRDFRINSATLDAALLDQQSSGSQRDEDDPEPKQKKKKL